MCTMRRRRKKVKLSSRPVIIGFGQYLQDLFVDEGVDLSAAYRALSASFPLIGAGTPQGVRVNGWRPFGF